MSRGTMLQPGAWPGESCAEKPAREAGAAALEGEKAVAGGQPRVAVRCPAEQPLTVAASPVVEHRLRTRRLSGHGSRAQPLRGMWDLPGPGHEPVSPASAGGLSTTAPPGKPKTPTFLYYFSSDGEEDMYRAADEIEKEKELLIHERGSSEPRLSVAPEMDIMDYCKKEWRGNTQKATCMKKGYEEVSQKFTSIRRVRGDNYCALRATLFQAMSQPAALPSWLQDPELTLWTDLAELRTAEARQIACDELFTNEEEEYSLYEAVKFLMLNRAIELYDDKEKGREVPFFSVLLFARDTSGDPGQLLRNHLNQVGHAGGLEQVEMFLLAYAVRHTIQVYRLSKYSTEEFITVYPTDPPRDWPVVTLIAEDDRHYNIPVRVCEETSL
ncbi:ubiquitin thioesterase otulin isoform X2 [Lagenorhynchus albirostris]|uniref:ubiquitin thioesterase otulin isoform X2 n=1 Tax=Lagenorhynchus albirostris TaxID=27610 RepID=UPI0028E1A23A|nr:ubiquitin thioesterase otulin isoform X2 [Lagenorhynchus albirostris]